MDDYLHAWGLYRVFPEQTRPNNIIPRDTRPTHTRGSAAGKIGPWDQVKKVCPKAHAPCKEPADRVSVRAHEVTRRVTHRLPGPAWWRRLRSCGRSCVRRGSPAPAPRTWCWPPARPVCGTCCRWTPRRSCGTPAGSSPPASIWSLRALWHARVPKAADDKKKRSARRFWLVRQEDVQQPGVSGGYYMILVEYFSVLTRFEDLCWYR